MSCRISLPPFFRSEIAAFEYLWLFLRLQHSNEFHSPEFANLEQPEVRINPPAAKPKKVTVTTGHGL